jgi:hypothetical protein
MFFAVRAPSPDVPERQVSIEYLNGPDGLVWRQRLLLQSTAAPGVWVCATPEHDVERVGLAPVQLVEPEHHETRLQGLTPPVAPDDRVVGNTRDALSRKRFMDFKESLVAQMETVVAPNPEVPDFKDLDALIGSTIYEVVGLVLPDYDKFIATAQQAEDFTLKQRRFWRAGQYVYIGGRPRGGGDGDNSDGGSPGGDGPKSDGQSKRGRTINEVVGLVLPDYNKFIAPAPQAEDFTLKQRRLWREEQYVDFGGRPRGGGDGDKGDGGSPRADGPTDDGKGKCGRGCGSRDGRVARAAALGGA